MSLNEIELLQEQFEFEFCSECYGDWFDHFYTPFILGDYGLCPFFYCDITKAFRDFMENLN